MPVTQETLDEAISLLADIRERTTKARQALYELIGRQAVLAYDQTLPREPMLEDLIKMAEETLRVSTLIVADAEQRVRNLEWRASNGLDVE